MRVSARLCSLAVPPAVLAALCRNVGAAALQWAILIQVQETNVELKNRAFHGIQLFGCGKTTGYNVPFELCAFANAAGMSSLLVLSGVTSIDTMKASLEEGTVAPPTFVGDDVGVLTDALELMRQTPAAAASAECPAS